MDEILNKLLQSELLSEDTKTEISEQWNASVETFKTQVREEVSMEVRSELAEQWISERDELIAKLDSFVSEALVKEMDELKGDIERFRDLEVEYAEKLVEEKQRLAEEVATEIDSLVDKMDAFFEMRLQSEFEDLREDLEIVKQNDFGRKMFEAYASTYATSFVDEDAVQSKLVVAESKLADAEHQLAALEEERNKMIREAKMDQVLSSLTGKKREQMAMVLKNVDTNRLEESYKFFIGRILKEEDTSQAGALLSEEKINTTVRTGDTVDTITPAQPKQIDENLASMKRLAGLTK